MAEREPLPPDLVHDLAQAIDSAATEIEAEDWIVKNIGRFPQSARDEIIGEFINKHFGSGLHWRPWAQMDVSVKVKSGRVFHSAHELIGYLHEFQRKFPFGHGTNTQETR